MIYFRSWMVIVAAVIVMFQVAGAEDRSPVLWSALTLALCLGAGLLVPSPLMSGGLGLFASFLLMFALNLAKD